MLCQIPIFSGHREDYGITPLEANAAGRSVIAQRKGGVSETMEPYTKDDSKAGALLFSYRCQRHYSTSQPL